MPGYFLDTSALAKLYHQESGSDHVERILNEQGSKGIISRLSLVEFESVLAIKVRTGVLDSAGRTIALRRFRADIAGNRIIVGPSIEERHFQSAARLLRVHAVDRGLRTLDGIQLAVALDLHNAAWISVLVSSDQRMCTVAELCGCPAVDPADPGLVL
ncbi:MAG TPA: type II toxin-antitoxin system VapC family toxin [Bryobacteraceae bacterium]|nr:type II toxin-antitoxin system VapC family toxin [Bryobacteraceae bacterium]